MPDTEVTKFETQTQPQKSSKKGTALAITGVLAVAFLVAGAIYKTELTSAFKLLFHLQPSHAKHIPRSALTVSRTNIASIALKTGLRGSSNDPVYKKILEYGSKLYPRFDQLLANPVKETGIELAEDAYSFFELLDEKTPGVGVLFGISDQKQFAEFIQRIKPGTPATEAGVSVVKLDNNANLYWNKSFGLIYAGGSDGRGKQRAQVIMALNKADSIVEDPRKKGWLEGKDDFMVSVDLEKIVQQVNPNYSAFLNSAIKPEVYNGSSLNLAFNFDKGKLGFDARANGTALLAEISKTAVPPSKEFLSGIAADNYQGFFTTHIQLAPLLETVRQVDPQSFRKANDLMEMFTKTSIDQLADSFTGDVCVVMENFSQKTSVTSSGRDFFGNQLPPVRSTSTKVDGTVAFGIKPGSAVVELVNKLMTEIPSKDIKRDGKVYKVFVQRDYYLLADNGYLALSTRRDAAKALADRKKDDKAAMPAALLDRASGGLATLELKLAPLFATALESKLVANDARATFEQISSRFKELRVSSRMEKERAVSQFELFFKDESKNSLNQIAEMSIVIADTTFAEYRVKACNSAAVADLRNAKTSMEAYFADHQQYPNSLAEANFKPTSGVDVICEYAPNAYACVSRHKEGNRLYATMYNEPAIRTKQCAKGEKLTVLFGSEYETLDRL
jgi:hypothetical protein